MDIRWVSSAVILMLVVGAATAADSTEVGLYNVHETSLTGPAFKATDSPSRDVKLSAVWMHVGSGQRIEVQGFYDGDGRGGVEGKVFKIRFTPTQTGRWVLEKVQSNEKTLDGQKQGSEVVCVDSSHHGFWVPDEVCGNRWYTRSDGSHEYIFGNTMYTFLSERNDKGPSGGNIAEDVRRNTEYFKKIRFSVTGGRYPHPQAKPFLDDKGRPSDHGDYSHRPNPQWFHQRLDLAVRTAFEQDLIADMIICGPDTVENRSILKAAANGGDNEPYLRYIAARYGAYPNVWICLCNEFDIKTPSYSCQEIAKAGSMLRGYVPYPVPLSVHAKPRDWYKELNTRPAWHDHVILQNKIKKLPVAADFVAANYELGGKCPVIDDELAYEGAGDGWSEADVIESHLGAFIGGGYGTTGHKPAAKKGHYFFGNFKASEHKSADNLKWLREVIDDDVTFWRMEPVAAKDGKAGIFENLGGLFRAMAWEGNEYVMAANSKRDGMKARLPAGKWRVRRYDVIAKKAQTLAERAEGEFQFDVGPSRATLVHFLKVGR